MIHHRPIANMATISPKRGFSVTTIAKGKQPQTQSTNRKARLEPAIRDAQNILPPWSFKLTKADQSWPTLTSRSLQSIARPFQKRFREVFGNARILICYLFIKAWKEKSLPKSHLGWFFLVFGEGKATTKNISIFWFIWPLTILFKEERDPELVTWLSS